MSVSKLKARKTSTLATAGLIMLLMGTPLLYLLMEVLVPALCPKTEYGCSFEYSLSSLFIAGGLMMIYVVLSVTMLLIGIVKNILAYKSEAASNIKR